jgi:hypothetical protein
MYRLFIWGETYGFVDLDGGLIHNFLGPEAAMRVASAIWAQKNRDFRAHLFKRPEKWIYPHPSPYVQPHINNRYIGNFMDKIQETRERQEISGPIQR